MNEVNDIDLFGSWIELGMVIAAIAGGILISLPAFIRWRKNVSNKKSNLQSDLHYPQSFNWDIHTTVHEILTELRVQTDSARSQIVQFHNGGHFLDGISMKKMTCTHESINTGVSGEGDRKKDLAVTMFLPLLNLIKDNIAKIHITSAFPDTYCKKFMETSSVIAFSSLPIRHNNNIVGYIMCQWCSWNKTDAIDEISIENEMESARNRIEIYLGQQLKKNINI